jgi:hypothetical protein
MTAALHAVLTGDIVHSTKPGAAPMAEVRAALEAATQAAQATWGEVIGTVDVFRGDSWQVALTSPRYALHTALLIRAALRADCDMDTRIAIGIGPVEAVDAARVSRSVGEAFLVSGRMLDAMRRGKLALAQAAHTPPQGPWLEAALGLLDHIAGGWTRRQADLVRLRLTRPNASQAELGAALRPPLAKQNAGRMLTTLGWEAVEPSLAVFAGLTWSG